MSPRARTIVGTIAALFVAAAVTVATDAGSNDSSDSSGRPPSEKTDTSAARDTPSEPGPSERSSDLPTIARADLPQEAIDVLVLIDHDGPYPYSQDGAVFQNREGILPSESTGYYHEYTVPTPSSSDRGARRIVVGADGARYYTDDHYASFREIVDQ
jgi:ribonuclease T1